jgi:hypothetical protein
MMSAPGTGLSSPCPNGSGSQIPFHSLSRTRRFG